MVARFCGHVAPWLVAKQQRNYAASELLDYIATRLRAYAAKWLRDYRLRSSTARWLRSYATSWL